MSDLIVKSLKVSESSSESCGRLGFALQNSVRKCSTTSLWLDNIRTHFDRTPPEHRLGHNIGRCSTRPAGIHLVGRDRHNSLPADTVPDPGPEPGGVDRLGRHNKLYENVSC